ncbi:gamma-glutamyltransferase [Crossiella cryophila]|uniref:Glutathione hydrolase proenzyme n=1 Tax=Crossiella cryophila TaxID=43355 RepID=A0A7W7C7R9_9PSEU|nr:gamma-glutamyltransferase [Crossiella cryophila]MBB4676022.1 gamma-glutamyltranspeptidase/glutathione hydrolase [Crossiella cryophila]
MRTSRPLRAAVVLCATAAVTLTSGPAAGAVEAGQSGKRPSQTGYGGAVSTVDEDATKAGIEALRRGGNAVDAAVAAAAALGVTEPFSAGIGGGGFFVYYEARTGRVHTIDGRETAPKRMKRDSFVEDGKAIPFEEAVTSGLSVGVPGTPQTWQRALDKWGRKDLAENLRPAIRLARDGFTVDKEYRDHTWQNEARFRAIAPTAKLFLPGGKLPEVGSTFRNPDLAQTYEGLGQRGLDWLYRGELGREIVHTVNQPPVAAGATIKVRPGLMETGDLAGYRVEDRAPTKIGYRGLDVYSMAPPSSGGSTVGEALNIMERFPLSRKDVNGATHTYLEASRLAYADRNKWIGDPAFVDVPLRQLMSDSFAKDRACLIDPKKAMPHPAPAGDPLKPGGCKTTAPGPDRYEGTSTTHLSTADAWGNVVAYTLTIEQTGGSAITVPHRGFLLNNELTDFDFAPPAAGQPWPANAPEGGKRPRSSMSPTIVLKDGKPLLALGSPGGSTIITTVLQTLFNRIDLGMTLPQAVAAPRLSQRNRAKTEAEPAFFNSPKRAELEAYGQQFELPSTTFTPNPEIGTVAALEFLGHGRIQAVAEPVRRGGGSAKVLFPTGP